MSRDDGGRHAEVRRKIREILAGLARNIRLPLGPTVALADETAQLFYARGDTIFSPSETHDFSYVVVEGVVRLECVSHRDDPVTIQLVRDGQLFGVSWLPLRRARAIRAVAHTDVVAALLDQRTVARFLTELSEEARMNVFSFSSRAQSALVVHKGALRTLPTADRLLYSLRALVPRFGRLEGDRVSLDVELSSADLGRLVGASPDTIRHVVSCLKTRGVLWREGRHLRMQARVAGGPEAVSRGEPYRGVPAEWARAKLGELAGRCRHGLNARAAEFIRKTAGLHAVADEGLLLPPGSDDHVAFVVSGSAWLEAAESWGRPFAVQLIPPGHFVRLPTRPSSRGIRMRGRGHRSCVVGLLTTAEMTEAMSLLSVDGQRTLYDATTRGMTRHLCDCTTSPTRPSACRLLSTFGFLAHDFAGRAERGVAINVPVSRGDLARLVDVDPATISKATDTLRADGWIERVARDRYVLLKLPPQQGASGDRCPYCAAHPTP